MRIVKVVLGVGNWIVVEVVEDAGTGVENGIESEGEIVAKRFPEKLTQRKVVAAAGVVAVVVAAAAVAAVGWFGFQMGDREADHWKSLSIVGWVWLWVEKPARCQQLRVSGSPRRKLPLIESSLDIQRCGCLMEPRVQMKKW